MGPLKKLMQVFAKKEPNNAATDAEESEHHIQELIVGGNTAEDNGQFVEALRLYELALSKNEGNARSHINIGNAMQKLGRHSDAIAAYQKALAINAASVPAFYNMGNSYAALGRHDEAIDAYVRATQINGEFTDAHIALANTYHDTGRYQDAVPYYQRALALQPDYAEVYESLGTTYLELKSFEEAVKSFRSALALNPTASAVHLRLAEALLEAGHGKEARLLAIQVVQLGVKDVGVMIRVGLLFRRIGDLVNSESSFRQAISLDLGNAIAHSNLGGVLADRGQFQQAIESQQRAVALAPSIASIHANLGAAFGLAGMREEAIVASKKALEIDPSLANCHSNLGVFFKDLGRMEEAKEHLLKAIEIDSNDSSAYSNYLFCISHAVNPDPAQLFREHCDFNRRYAQHIAAYTHRPYGRRANPRIKLGFVSGDFLNHAMMFFFLPIFLQLVQRASFDIYLYSSNAFEDDVTQLFREKSTKWTSAVGLGNGQLAQVIYDDQVDVLIDLSGHTGKNRLLAFAHKPSPVQVTWMGYPGTTGLAAMDYYLTDAFFLPPGQFDNQFTEKLVYLPASAPFVPKEGGPELNALPALAHGAITFGSFNRLDKISPAVIALWAQVLRAHPTSRMLVGGMQSAKAPLLLEWFANEGIGSERLVIHQRSDMKTYLELHHQVDICLDTFPYNGGTTTLYALWMGVPTLTLSGVTVAGRTGSCVLAHVGLQAFAVTNSQEFVEQSLVWAGQLEQLAEIRANLRKRLLASPLGQPAVVAEGLEKAVKTMYQKWAASEPTTSFQVTPAMLV